MVASTRAPLRIDRLRALNVPQPVHVVVNDDGLPTTVASETPDHVIQGNGPIHRTIEEILEVWRIDDEWWRQPLTRRYLDVVLAGGSHVILFQDLHTGEWFLQMP